MAAPMEQQQHHVKLEKCTTRPKYRDGRQATSVKVYTINDESQYLLVQGIPAVGTSDELVKLCSLHGDVAEHRLLKEYPAEEFCETMLIKFKRIQSARHAKRKLDEMNFYGGSLHICYAPEFESTQETREKLQDRRRAIASRVRKLAVEKEELEKQATAPLEKDSGSRDEGVEMDETPEETEEEHKDSGVETLPQSSLPGYDPRNELQSHGPPPPRPPAGIPPLPYHPVLPPPRPPFHPYSHPPGMHYPPRFPGPGPPPHFSPFPDDVPNSLPHRPFLPQPPLQLGVPPTPQEWYPEHYDGRLEVPSNRNTAKQTEKETETQDSETAHKPAEPLVRKLDPKPAGKLVPRQVKKRKVLPERLLQQVTRATRDSVNEELRRNAFILGDVTGPTKTDFDEIKRREKSATGDEQMDDTVLQIRQKVQEFAAVALPPQLKRKRTKPS